MNRYILILQFGFYKPYIAYRKGNAFYYGYGEECGASSIDYRNKSVVEYKKLK